MFIQNFTCFSTSTFLPKNRQGNVNSFCIVQFSRSFFLTLSFWSLRRLCYYITSFRVCQEVFQNYFLNFSWFSSKSTWFWGFLSPLFSSLSIISLSFRFVKRFFKISFYFFLIHLQVFFSGRDSRLRDSLFIISLCFHLVKRFFKIFWKTFDFRSLRDLFCCFLSKA